MRIEYLIVYHDDGTTNILETLATQLIVALINHDNEFDESLIGGIIVPETERVCETVEENGRQKTRVIYGFRLDLPDETNNPELVRDEFTDALADSEPIVHVLKFHDDLLLSDLRELAEELFELEMRLRRVLSSIYLGSYKDDFFNLLREERAEPFKKDGQKPQPDQMKTAAENEFFHLSFGQYIALNERKLPMKVETVLDLIRGSDSFDDFRQNWRACQSKTTLIRILLQV